MELDFDGIRAALMPRARFIIEEWLPGGKWSGDEYVVRNPTRNDKRPGSFKFNSTKGIFQEFAEDGQKGSGGDMISLYAYLRGINNGLAARLLVKQYLPAMDDKSTANSDKSKKRKPPPMPDPPLTPPPSDDKDIKLVHPVPDNAPPLSKQIHYDHGFPVKIWECLDAEGKLLCASARFESKGPDGKIDKTVLPLTFWSDGKWHWKGWPTDNGNTQPLFGLHDLAQRPNARVWVVEGEKCREAWSAIEPNDVVVTWHGGGKRVHKVDWSPLNEREAILWPDADPPGLRAMRAVAKLLQGQAAVSMVEIPKGKEQGWDCADAIEERLLTKDLKIQVAGKVAEQPDVISSIQWPFRFLGYDHGTYYYHPAGQNQVIELASRNHSKTNLLVLAPLEFWENTFEGGRTGVQWDAAINAMIRMQEIAGPYDSDRIRGRGVWKDGDEIVLHSGDKIHVGENQLDISEFKTDYIYENRPKIRTSFNDPMDSKEAFEVAGLADRFTWADPVYSKYFVGWLALSSVCGALPWRPSVWITGPSGSGKSWVTTNVAFPLVGALSIYALGESSAAGLRQKIKHDAIPVVVDEAESEDHRQADRIQAMLTLMRQSSSDSGAKIYKGTTRGESMDWSIRSMFYFSSVGTGTKQHADENRISVLKILQDRSKDKDAKFEKLELDAERILTPDYCSRWRGRAFHNIDKIIETAKTFSKAISLKLGSKRMGDQTGYLWAGWWMMENDEAITYEQAKELVGYEKFKEEKNTLRNTDEANCLATLLQLHIRVPMDRGSAEDRSLGEIIQDANEEVSFDGALRSLLLRYGIKVDTEKETVYICGRSTPIMKRLRDTPWALSYHQMLQRVDGVKSVARMRFGPGFFGPTAAIPFYLIMGEDENATLPGDANE